MPRKVATTIDLKTALDKRCPILLCVPETVPHLSQVFNDEGITDKKLGMKTIKEWVKNHQKLNHAHAVIETENWQDFENAIDAINRSRLLTKLSIAYEGRAISYTNAMMQFDGGDILDDRWGNGAGAYILYEDENRCVGMARLFNEGGHFSMKIPYREKGQNDIKWSEKITPDLKGSPAHSDKKPQSQRPYTFAEHSSRIFE